MLYLCKLCYEPHFLIWSSRSPNSVAFFSYIFYIFSMTVWFKRSLNYSSFKNLELGLECNNVRISRIFNNQRVGSTFSAKSWFVSPVILNVWDIQSLRHSKCRRNNNKVDTEKTSKKIDCEPNIMWIWVCECPLH